MAGIDKREAARGPDAPGPVRGQLRSPGPSGCRTRDDLPPAQPYASASPTPVTRLRYDPNEDPGARRWHLYSVRLAADCQAPLRFAVTWHDAAFLAGSTVRLYARHTAGNMYFLGNATEKAGLNSFLAPLSTMPRGKYTVIIYVTSAAGVRTTAVANGPLIKT